jgi:hypothetical protein
MSAGPSFLYRDRKLVLRGRGAAFGCGRYKGAIVSLVTLMRPVGIKLLTNKRPASGVRRNGVGHRPQSRRGPRLVRRHHPTSSADWTAYSPFALSASRPAYKRA